MIAVLFGDSRVARPVLEATAHHFEASPGPLKVEVRGSSPEQLPEGAPWSELWRRCDNLRRDEGLSDDAIVIYATSSSNEHNWFSAVQEEPARSNIFIDAADWDWIVPSPLEDILAYEVVLNVLQLRARCGGGDWKEMVHEESIGCLNDFCAAKADFALKIRTADVCEACLETYERLGLSQELLSQSVAVLERCRGGALATARFRATAPSFSAWAYPVAVTRHKATQAQGTLHQLMLLADHFDCLVRYACLVRAVETRRPLQLVENPSLGWWVTKLRDLEEEEACRIIESNRIVKARNDRAHGYAMVADSAYPGEIEARRLALTGIERVLAPHLSRKLWHAESLALREGQYWISGYELMGSNSLFSRFERGLAGSPTDVGIEEMNRVGIWEDSRGRFQSLHPHLVRQSCPTCREWSVLLTDGVKYIDVRSGHRVARSSLQL